MSTELTPQGCPSPRARRLGPVARRGRVLSLLLIPLLSGCYVFTDTPESGPCAGRRPLALHSTMVGVHGLSDPVVARQLDTPMVRMILADHQIRRGFEALDRGEEPDFVAALHQLRADGVTVVVAVRWPVEPDAMTPDPDRVPVGEDRVASLALLERFLVETAGYVDWYQLGNEVVGGPGAYYDRAGGLLWLEELAERACETRRAHAELAELRIMSPGLTALAERAGGVDPNPETTAFIEDVIDLAESHTEALDVHLHVEDLDSLIAQIDWVQDRTSHPLVAMEWSNAKVAKTWLSQPAAPEFGSGSNRDVIRAAYLEPMTPEEWGRFLSGSPHHPGFLDDAMAAMDQEGVQLAAYGGAFQYGQPIFDMKALHANQTVTPSRTSNQPFYDEFVAVAAEYRGQVPE